MKRRNFLTAAILTCLALFGRVFGYKPEPESDSYKPLQPAWPRYDEEGIEISRFIAVQTDTDIVYRVNPKWVFAPYERRPLTRAERAFCKQKDIGPIQEPALICRMSERLTAV